MWYILIWGNHISTNMESHILFCELSFFILEILQIKNNVHCLVIFLLLFLFSIIYSVIQQINNMNFVTCYEVFLIINTI